MIQIGLNLTNLEATRIKNAKKHARYFQRMNSMNEYNFTIHNGYNEWTQNKFNGWIGAISQFTMNTINELIAHELTSIIFWSLVYIETAKMMCVILDGNERHEGDQYLTVTQKPSRFRRRWDGDDSQLGPDYWRWWIVKSRTLPPSDVQLRCKHDRTGPTAVSVSSVQLLIPVTWRSPCWWASGMVRIMLTGTLIDGSRLTLPKWSQVQ